MESPDAPKDHSDPAGTPPHSGFPSSSSDLHQLICAHKAENPDSVISDVHKCAAEEYTAVKKRKQAELRHKIAAASRTGDRLLLKNQKKKNDNHASAVASRVKQEFLIGQFEKLVRDRMATTRVMADKLLAQEKEIGQRDDKIRMLSQRVDMLQKQLNSSGNEKGFDGPAKPPPSPPPRSGSSEANGPGGDGLDGNGDGKELSDSKRGGGGNGGRAVSKSECAGTGDSVVVKNEYGMEGIGLDFRWGPYGESIVGSSLVGSEYSECFELSEIPTDSGEGCCADELEKDYGEQLMGRAPFDGHFDKFHVPILDSLGASHPTLIAQRQLSLRKQLSRSREDFESEWVAGA